MDEELLSRQPPQSLEAEQAVLGSILIDSRCVADVIGLVKPDDFFLEQNREIYETIYTMFNFSETIDPVTVLDKMRALGNYHDNSRDYIMQLMEITPTAANVVRYAGIVREKSMLRGLGNAATPMGIQAVQRMKDPNCAHLATDQMCRLIVLNTASIQLIPANVAAVRTALGCPTPFDILPAVWVTSVCSASAGLLAAFALGKLWRRE